MVLPVEGVALHGSLTLKLEMISSQIAALEFELMQLMKQNGIQVNNNNSAQRSPGKAGPARGESQGNGEIQKYDAYTLLLL